MTIDYAPFSTAQAHLLEAAQWLQDLLLPHDHQERICADVAEGQRRAAREIELAIGGLLEFGTERALVAEEDCSPRRPPRYQTDVLDPDSVAAAEAIAELTAGLRGAAKRGHRYGLSQAFIDTVSTMLERHYSSRLAGEASVKNLTLTMTDSAGR